MEHHPQTTCRHHPDDLVTARAMATTAANDIGQFLASHQVRRMVHRKIEAAILMHLDAARRKAEDKATDAEG